MQPPTQVQKQSPLIGLQILLHAPTHTWLSGQAGQLDRMAVAATIELHVV
jgi:hypothetical protein